MNKKVVGLIAVLFFSASVVAISGTLGFDTNVWETRQGNCVINQSGITAVVGDKFYLNCVDSSVQTTAVAVDSAPSDGTYRVVLNSIDETGCDWGFKVSSQEFDLNDSVEYTDIVVSSGDGFQMFAIAQSNETCFADIDLNFSSN